ncbi:hypothetical protein RJ639_031572 [Escallonia herrerae]|uniref:Cysteine protease n=1 Tax=Escallonia herrerae TaxID=1293975 RepID=A0AA88XG18_9ASTE|nr:hypothetical protein RJ639_031572 [Escallonia herrerae]
MRGSRETTVGSKHSVEGSTDLPNRVTGSACSEPGTSDGRVSKTSTWSGILVSAFSIFGTYSSSKDSEKKQHHSRNHGWTAAVRRVVNANSMWRLGLSKTNISSSTSDIWLLGVCYRIAQEDSSADPAHSDGFASFVEDFSSRILITYRRGFPGIGDSKYTSDVNWGCMLRSSQMLVAQALVHHRLGRSWRKTLDKPQDRNYLEILHLFGDSEASAFSIHNLLEAGKAYTLAPGCWVGPYAMCRTWETLARCRIEQSEVVDQSLPMAVYVVSGDEDGERGGAPVVCIEDASRQCSEFSRGQVDWTPILLLVPLVLGLDKVNPSEAGPSLASLLLYISTNVARYIPMLAATFTFPQSLGILGGRPSASTYLVGVQDGKAYCLDPHEVQPHACFGFLEDTSGAIAYKALMGCVVTTEEDGGKKLLNLQKAFRDAVIERSEVVDIKKENLEADTSSYHCNVVRQVPLDSIDPSLSIGFYCRDKDDFNDFCSRASELADQSDGAPLFTVTQIRNSPKPAGDSVGVQEDDSFDVVPSGDGEGAHEDDWQLL